jgi:K+-sensing histidine kinase KdpD
MDQIFSFFSLIGAISGLLTAVIGICLVNYFFTQNRFDSLLDEQLNELVLTFQSEIPMAGTFLKGKLADNLKARAKEKLLRVVPKLKKKMAVELMWKILLAGAFIGFTVGLLFNLIIS